ncbi:hypothetical protein JQC67_04455 [Aurantibacter crassamenti]|nr:hypothetical protein [Aurantibacter crassamenti]MBM1105387.1 hypothetical protein [Aurantibacter crassamenti]
MKKCIIMLAVLVVALILSMFIENREVAMTESMMAINEINDEMGDFKD